MTKETSKKVNRVMDIVSVALTTYGIYHLIFVNVTDGLLILILGELVDIEKGRLKYRDLE